MLWVRFTQADEEMRTTPAQGDLPFELTLCNL
jgi:cell division FtsZ-interacting protein ZapD